MLEGMAPVAFLATRDLAKASRFYHGVLGLPLHGNDGDALLFDCNGILLRVSKVLKFAPASYTVFGWQVPNVDQIIAQLNASGIRCEQYAGMPQDSNGVWIAPNFARVAWFKDPDGNVLSLTQML